MTTSTLDIALDAVRGFRTTILSTTDWAALPDAPLSDTVKTQYQNYRQYLRDIPVNMPEATVNAFVESDILSFEGWVAS